LSLLSLERSDLRLEFDVLHLLAGEVSLEFVLNSIRTKLDYLKRSLPLGFNLEGLSDFNTFVTEDILELLLLVTEHLHFALVELDVFIHSSDHFLNATTVRHRLITYLELGQFVLQRSSSASQGLG
jgi:hypothetical protein